MAEIGEALRRHKRIGMDTSVFICHNEGHPRYADTVSTIFRRMTDATFEGVTSVLALMELVVRPFQLGREDIAQTYELVLDNLPNLRIVDVDRVTARRTAQLRAK
ncbi:MAG TPA: hypothetical protein VH482_27835 [Thermomicrobiales bacterium]